jgi:Gpi18-like mannosyltransferase
MMKEKQVRFYILGCGVLFFLFLVLGKNIFTRLYSPTFSIYTDSWIYLLLSGLFSLFYIVIMFILNKFKKFKLPEFLVFSFVIASLLMIRILLLDSKNYDYINYLAPWVKDLSKVNFKEFLLMNVGDYNFSYLYILFGISKIYISDLYLIKIVSIVFDIFLSFVVAKIVGLFKEKSNWQNLIFVLVFALPTVVLNSSCWGQCDVIYTSLVLFGLFLFLKKKLNWSMFFFGLSLAFKLQSIFVLPLIVLLLFKKELKLKNILFYGLGFLIPSIPPLIAGRGLINTFSVYLTQVSSQNALTWNAPNFWSMMSLPFLEFNLIAILITAMVLVVIFYFSLLKNKKITKIEILNLFFLFSLVVPYFLPKMHERYFFIAEISSILYFIFNPKKWYYPLIIQICSLSNYVGFLFGNKLFDLRISGLLIGILVFIILREEVVEKC